MQFLHICQNVRAFCLLCAMARDSDCDESCAIIVDSCLLSMMKNTYVFAALIQFIGFAKGSL